ncbi:response regulator [Brevundimonas vesicularis]|uniref:response regulator n=1 Tax=Brevundimonas vesicularis TaxID=41276 RepID=UPI0038D3D2FF
MKDKLTLLHVDDEADIREVAALSFEVDPMTTYASAASGEEALSILDKGLRPDVILLDVMMPGMDGPTVFKHVRQRPELKRSQIIFMTARAQGSEVADYKALGAIGVIIKPFDPMRLMQEVRDLLAGANG